MPLNPLASKFSSFSKSDDSDEEDGLVPKDKQEAAYPSPPSFS
jgi:hypothetical protein